MPSAVNRSTTCAGGKTGASCGETWAAAAEPMRRVSTEQWQAQRRQRPRRDGENFGGKVSFLNLSSHHSITSSARMEVEAMFFYGRRGQSVFTTARSARRRASTGAARHPRYPGRSKG